MICLQIPTLSELVKNHFCQPMYVHGINDIRQTKIHPPELLVPKPSYLSKQKIIHYVLRYTNLLILLGIWKNWQSNGRNLLLPSPINKKGDKKSAAIIKEYHCYKLHTRSYPTFFSQGWIHIQTKLLWIISVDADTVN